MNSVKVENLNFSYENRKVINDLSFSLEKGDRCLLVGGNGAGKTTLLRLLAGKSLTDSITVLGKHSYRDTCLNFKRTYLHQNWGLRTVSFAGHNIPYIADIKVSEMMKDLQTDYPERREELIKLLKINLNWRMHQVSDGQRRRVQIFLGLLRPVELILLDEISNVLDIMCRESLFNWLKKESIERGVTIIYATHIFDGIDDWYNKVLYLKLDNSSNSLGFYGGNDNIKIGIYSQVKEWLINDKENSEKIKDKSKLEKSYNSAGGFAPGRFYNYW